jgi:hypothetical protein
VNEIVPALLLVNPLRAGSNRLFAHCQDAHHL